MKQITPMSAFQFYCDVSIIEASSNAYQFYCNINNSIESIDEYLESVDSSEEHFYQNIDDLCNEDIGNEEEVLNVNRLFVNNFPCGTKLGDLLLMFNKFGTVNKEHSFLKHNKHCNFAIIEFNNIYDAQKAQKILNNCLLKDRCMKVKFDKGFKKKSASKNKNKKDRSHKKKRNTKTTKKKKKICVKKHMKGSI